MIDLINHICILIKILKYNLIIITHYLVHDGHPHRIEIYIKGITLTLKIDNYEPQIVANSGSEETFVLKSKNFLYIGGIPIAVGVKATTAFHLKQPYSFKGLF